MSTIDMGGKLAAEVALVGEVDGKLEAVGAAEPPVRGIYGCGTEPTAAPRA